jgi:hypothetical protein
MADPKVSFVVPCYRLAHLLGECLDSIQKQSYSQFEVLVMDDCSPDNTGEVVASFNDPRIHHIRNNPNIGHLKNYNKGIELSSGEYVWLISADDRLAKPYVLERYLQVLEKNPRIGYAFCPAMALIDGKHAGVEEYSVHGTENAVLDGQRFLVTSLLKSNGVPAASGLVRRKCYQDLGCFPLDMPFAGDWYLWCLFALHYDVAYFAEPMVEYRKHSLAMTSTLSRQNIRACIDDDLALPTRIYREAECIAAREVMEACREQMAVQLGQYLSVSRIRGVDAQISIEDCERKLAVFARDPGEEIAIESSAFALAGDRFSLRNDFASASAMYARALKLRPVWPRLWIRSALIRAGRPGRFCIQTLAHIRSR